MGSEWAPWRGRWGAAGPEFLLGGAGAVAGWGAAGFEWLLGGAGAAGGGPGHFGGSFGAAFGGVTGAADGGAPLEVVAISLGGGCLGRALRSILWRSCEKREKLSSMKLKL